MADFVAPENQGTSEDKGFVAPENAHLTDVVKESAKKLLSPLSAFTKPADVAGKVATTPDTTLENLNAKAKREGYVSLEQSPDYPNQNYTSLAPTLDAFQAPFIVKDIASLGVKGATKLFGKTAETKGLEEFISKMPEINALPPKPELPLGPVSTSPAATMKAPLMEEKGLQGPLPTLDQLKAQIAPKSMPVIEAYPKGTMGGGISPNTGKPLPTTTIWGVRGDPKEIEKLGFGPDPASIPEHIIKQKGIPIAGEAPKPSAPVFGETPAPAPYVAPENAITLEPSDVREINKKGKMSLPVGAEDLSLPGTEAKKGVPTKPFSLPEQEHPLLPGAKERINQFVSTEGKDISAHHPFSTSADQATQVGKLEPVMRDQLQAGLSAEAEAERKANAVLQNFKKTVGFEPESLDSKALSMYARSPNKAAAREALIAHVGEGKANKFVEAEKQMRTTYDNLLDRMNVERAKQGESLISHKEDYLPQLHEMNVLTDMGLPKMIGTQEGTDLVQKMMTDAEQLKASKWYHSADIAFRHLKQQGLPDVEDAVTGYQRYVREAERKIALQPHVNELRDTAEAIKDKYPNLSTEMIERADHIAGKANSLDESLKSTFGSKAMNAFYEATSRMKGNLIEGNPHVPISQTFVLPSIVADLPVRDAMGSAIKGISNPEFRNYLIANSPTLQLRLAAREASGINNGVLSKALSAPSDFVDTNTLLFAMGGKYMQLVRQGVAPAEAVKQAEQFASLTQATLSKLATAPVLRSKTSQAVVPFMNQVLSQAKYVTTQLFKNKTVAQKAGSALKLAATGAAIAAATQLIQGDKASTPLNPTQYVPMGPAMEQGLGGPVIGTAGRILKSKSVDEALTQTFRGMMLLQNKIPAGLQVSKLIEGMFKKPKRSED